MATQKTVGEIWCNECDYQTWLQQIICYAKERVGCPPMARMYAYEHGAQLIIAMDISGEQAGHDMSITIQVSPGTTILSSPVDDQLDITLPSIGSVIEFASCLHIQNRDKFLR